MKRFFHLMAIAWLVCMAASCELPIVDWAPVTVYIEATDAEGQSIISPEMPGMSLTFKGETYTVQDPGVRTRAYAAIMSGLIAVPVSQTEDQAGGQVEYQLQFGEIDGADDMDEDITLDWPDGSRDVIHYHCSGHIEWPSPRCNRSWKLNGKKHDGATFSFSGKSLPD